MSQNSSLSGYWRGQSSTNVPREAKGEKTSGRTWARGISDSQRGKGTLLQGLTICQEKNWERLFKRLSTNSRMGQMKRAKRCRGTMTLVIKRVKDASEASNQIWSADWPKEITSSLCVTELNRLGDAEAHPSNVAISSGSRETGSYIFTLTLTHTSGEWRRRPTHFSVTTNWKQWQSTVVFFGSRLLKELQKHNDIRTEVGKNALLCA